MGAIRVLLIDDEPLHREMCREALRACDEVAVEVVGEAHHGGVGIELAQSLQPDVIVLDLRMPVVDGYEALPQLQHFAPGARIVIWSSSADFLRSQAMGFEGVPFVPKLAPMSRLVEAIVGDLRAPRSAPEEWRSTTGAAHTASSDMPRRQA